MLHAEVGVVVTMQPDFFILDLEVLGFFFYPGFGSVMLLG